jgi:2-polyprenyl-6-methoxyphenol hydroxylase-like FAD-dependent oxidoreductase
MDADVIIVGAGPTGLMLAGELRLAGVRPLVLERRPQLRDTPKAGGLSGEILELVRYRGLLERFEAASTGPSPALRLPFGGLHVDFTHLAVPRCSSCCSHNRDSSACSTNGPASSAPRSVADRRWSG